MKRRFALLLAYVFFLSLLPRISSGDYLNWRAKNITGNSTGTISGFNIPLTLMGDLSVYDALTAWVDVRAYMDGQSGRPTLAAWQADNTIDVAASIRAAAAAVYTTGGNIIFPPGHYTMESGAIVIGNNVNLVGLGGVIHRRFKYDNTDALTNSVFSLYGNNIVTGIVFDGGGPLSSVYPGVQGQSYIYYVDFATNTVYPDIKIIGNTFDNSAGSFLSAGSQHMVISGNIFGDYRDHSIYFGNSGDYNTETDQELAITGNTFYGPTSTTTREAIKLNGAMTNISITGNVMNLPYVNTSAAIQLAARYNDNGCIGSATISGNTVYGLLGSFLFLGNEDDDTMFVDSVTVTGNVAKTKYGLYFGGRPNDAHTTQNGVRIKKVLVEGNTFLGNNAWLIMGRDGVGHDGIENLIIKGNYIEQTDIAYFMGNIKNLVIDGNTWVGTGQSYGWGFGRADLAGYNWYAGTVNTSFVGTASITNNVLSGYYQWLADTGVDATHPSTIRSNLFMDGNQMIIASNASSRILGTNASYLPLTKLTVGTNNFVSPTTTVGTNKTVNQFVWANDNVVHLGNFSPYGRRTYSGNPTGNLTSFFKGEVVIDTADNVAFIARERGSSSAWDVDSYLPLTGAVAPSTTPVYRGQEYINTVDNTVYKATCITDDTCWRVLN
jgi:hypothetical protein